MNRLTQNDLRATLRRIDGRGYRAYNDLKGFYSLDSCLLEIAHIQGDPYAPPSRVHIEIALSRVGESPAGRVASAPVDPASATGFLAMEDFLGRSIARQIERSGSRDIFIDRYGQEILRRSSVRVRGETVEIRLFVQLPAAGRRIRAREAEKILLTDLPALIEQAIFREQLDLPALKKHQEELADFSVLQSELARRSWVAFIADGSILPRRAGHDDRPFSSKSLPAPVRFLSPPEFEAVVNLPHAGSIRGMAIPTGVTLLVGGGFHGKSTLLDAIARGFYPHIPGDGRERVAADPRVLKVRAEDGRAVTGTDIRNFIGDLPFGRSTEAFSTQNASGSTSQAANIIEGIEAGARVLLLDEDTSATNFMIRDSMMRRLLKPGQEPITPFLDRVRNLHHHLGVSTILAVGGSGEYFRVADRVIQMDHYLPVDVTAAARQIAAENELERPAETETGTETGIDRDGDDFSAPVLDRRRHLRLDRYRRKLGSKGVRIKAFGTTRIIAMKEEIDLGACEQLISSSQTRTICEILSRLIEGRGKSSVWDDLSDGFTPAEIRETLEMLGEEQLDRSSFFRRGDLAEVRALEVIATLNRLRELKVDHRAGERIEE